MESQEVVVEEGVGSVEVEGMKKRLVAAERAKKQAAKQATQHVLRRLRRRHV